MMPHVKIDVNAGVLSNMSVEQFQALQNNILAPGKWESQVEPVHISGHGEYIGLTVGGMFIGIEKDGYTHS